MISPDHENLKELNKAFMKICLVDEYKSKTSYKESGAKWDASNKHWYT